MILKSASRMYRIARRTFRKNGLDPHCHLVTRENLVRLGFPYKELKVPADTMPRPMDLPSVEDLSWCAENRFTIIPGPPWIMTFNQLWKIYREHFSNPHESDEHFALDEAYPWWLAFSDKMSFPNGRHLANAAEVAWYFIVMTAMRLAVPDNVIVTSSRGNGGRPIRVWRAPNASTGAIKVGCARDPGDSGQSDRFLMVRCLIR